jgi:hypothetical protein
MQQLVMTSPPADREYRRGHPGSSKLSVGKLFGLGCFLAAGMHGVFGIDLSADWQLSGRYSGPRQDDFRWLLLYGSHLFVLGVAGVGSAVVRLRLSAGIMCLIAGAAGWMVLSATGALVEPAWNRRACLLFPIPIEVLAVWGFRHN